jgi:hypothetical protein
MLLMAAGVMVFPVSADSRPEMFFSMSPVSGARLSMTSPLAAATAVRTAPRTAGSPASAATAAT